MRLLLLIFLCCFATRITQAQNEKNSFSKKVAQKKLAAHQKNAFSQKVKSSSSAMMGSFFSVKKANKKSVPLKSTFSKKERTTTPTLLSSPFSKKQKAKTSLPQKNAFSIKVKKSKPIKSGDGLKSAFMAPVKMRGVMSEASAFSYKVKKVKPIKTGDGLQSSFMSPVKMKGLISEANAFSVSIKPKKLKGKKGQEGWIKSSFTTADKERVAFVESSEFGSKRNWLQNQLIRKNAYGKQNKLFAKRHKEKKVVSGDNTFTPTKKTRKRQSKKRTKGGEDLFQRGVLPN